MKRILINLFIITVLLSGSSFVKTFSQDLPAKPDPPRLVNDLAGMLNRDQVNALEQKLVAFSDSTSTQISIVTVPTLGGFDKSDYAQRLGEKWGIGKKQRNNGVLILVKPKQADSNGQIFIAQGYGLEGVLPDLTCSQIVDNDILPSFRTGDYYGGLNKAVNSIMAITHGEYTADDYAGRANKKAGNKMPFGLILFIVFIIIMVISRGGGSHRRNISTGGLPFWMLLGGMMGSGRGSSGSWGGFSGGGGGGGGFGGFRGGSFGGGGAGGSC